MKYGSVRFQSHSGTGRNFDPEAYEAQHPTTALPNSNGKKSWKNHLVLACLSLGISFLMIQLALSGTRKNLKLFAKSGGNLQEISFELEVGDDTWTKLLFDQFKTQFSKDYETKDEEMERFEIFKQNLQVASLRNKLQESSDEIGSGARHGVTKFSDWTEEEFNNLNNYVSEPLFKYVHEVDQDDDVFLEAKQKGFVYLPEDGNKIPFQTCAVFPELCDIPMDNLPTQFDWRDYDGIVGPVYDQGYCGSCWAFSSKQDIEGSWVLDGKHEYKDLSAQEIISCDEGNWGCNGGFPSMAFEFVVEMGGLVPTSIYPYESGLSWETGQCNNTLIESATKVLGRINGWTLVKGGAHYYKKALLKLGPMSIALKATGMQFYNGGIDDGSYCIGPVDHAVLLVGWGMEDGNEFWIIKNSWGPDWGEDGYYRILIQDKCQITAEGSKSLTDLSGFK